MVPITRAEPPVLLLSSKIGALLTQACFDNIHVQYFFADRPTFLLWEKTCMDGPSRKLGARQRVCCLICIHGMAYQAITAVHY